MGKKKKKKKKPRVKKRSRSSSGKASKLVREISGPTQWRAEVLESEIPVVVDFWATWCRPCLAMAPVFEQVARAHPDTVRFAKVDTQANPQIMQELNIRSIPTLIIFHQGKVFDVHVGVISAQGLQRMLRRVLDKHEGVGLMGKVKRLWSRDESTPEEEES